MFYENGPLVPFWNEQTQTVDVRRRSSFAWTDFGAVVYIDQPAGVSFSYSTNPVDYTLNSDTRAARDYHTFIQEFFKVNPTLANHDFYLAGESYAGAYLPMLGDYLVNDSRFIGILNGNPVFRCDRDEIGSTFQIGNLLFWHGYVSYSLMDEFWQADCTGAAARAGFESAKCKSLVDQMMTTVGQDFDSDDIYSDPCTGIFFFFGP